MLACRKLQANWDIRVENDDNNKVIKINEKEPTILLGKRDKQNKAFIT